MRQKMRKPLTDRAKELILSKLQELAGNDDVAKVSILEQSIERGWQGVFPVKDDAADDGYKILTPYAERHSADNTNGQDD
jgi:hypothetical protein